MSWFGEEAAIQAPIFNRLREYLSGEVDGNGPCQGDRYCMIRLRQWIREQSPSPQQIRLAKNIFNDYVDGRAAGRKRMHSVKHRSRKHRSRKHRSRKHRSRKHSRPRKRKKTKKR